MAKKLEIKAVLRAVDRASGPLRLAAKRIRMAMGSTFRGVGRGITGLGRMVTGLAGKLTGLAGIAGAGGLVAWTKSFVGAGSELAKFSRQVGISSDRLQELEYTAGLLDTSVPELRNSFSVLARNMGAMAGGTGELYSELKKTDRGLLKQLKTTKDTGKAFDLLIGALHAQPDAMKRARLAQVAFGRSGAKMIRFAEQGHIGLAQMAQEARKSGAIIGGPMLKQTEDFNDEIFRTQMAFKSMGVSIMRELLPVFGPLMQKMAAWLRQGENQKKVAAWFKDVVNAVVDGFPKVVAWLQKAGEWVSGLTGGMGLLKTAGIGLAAVFGVKLLAALGPVGALLTGIAAAAVWAVKKVTELIAANSKLNNQETEAARKKFEAHTLGKPVKLADGSIQTKQSELELYIEAAGRRRAARAGKSAESGAMFARGLQDTKRAFEFAQQAAIRTSASRGGVKGSIDVRVSASGGASVDKLTTQSNGVADIKAQGRRKSSVGR